MNLSNEIYDEIGALLELETDTAVQQLSRDKVHYYLDRSLEIGRLAAKNYESKSIYDLYQKNNILVEELLYDSKFTKMYRKRAEIKKRNKEYIVTLYTKTIEITRQSSDFMRERLQMKMFFSNEQLKQLYLAHEFYHYLEFTQLGFTYENLEKIKKKTFFGKSILKGLVPTSEIAAHAFAQTFCKFPMYPSLLEYFDLIFFKEMTELQFVELINNSKKIIIDR